MGSGGNRLVLARRFVQHGLHLWQQSLHQARSREPSRARARIPARARRRARGDFPFAGRTRFEWNNLRQGEIFGRAERAREEYRRRFEAQSEAMRALARRFGWSFLAHRTDARPETALIALHAQIGARQPGYAAA